MVPIHPSLFVHRGPEGGNMTTLGLEIEVLKTRSYRISRGNLLLTKSPLFAIDLEHKATHPETIKIPPHLAIAARWDEKPFFSGATNNILGDNGLLTLDTRTPSIPIVQATEEALAFYGATLVQEGDIVQFPEDHFPIFRMNVGVHYVRDFILTETGGGFYLEYHHDRPHFHMPIRGGGCYLLAKWNETKTHLWITGFQIPDGKAVYTKKGAIHCDAALTGDLLVGYTTSEACSTALLRTEQGEMVELQFVEPAMMST